jgi:DNA-binding NarL/FixJ family response regulator
MLADAMERALGSRGLPCVVATLHSATSVLEQVVQVAPDLVLVDLDLGPIDGLDLIGPIRARGSRVLIVTGCEDHRRLAAAVATGAAGWVAKARPFEDVLEAVESTCRDRPLFAPLKRDELTTTGRHSIVIDGDIRNRISTLTPRELEVLDGLVRGDSAKDMADLFVVSLGTVRTHIQSVLIKLGVSSQLAAAAIAVQWVAAKRGLDRDDLLAPLRSVTV